jgi:hypothetical protein
MPFEKFVQTGRSYKPKISIRSNGQIGLNFGAIEKFGLRKYKYAVLFYNAEESKVGIKFTNELEEGSLKLQIRDSNAAVSAKAFLDYYSINYSISKRYTIEWSENENLYTASLKQGDL